MRTKFLPGSQTCVFISELGWKLKIGGEEVELGSEGRRRLASKKRRTEQARRPKLHLHYRVTASLMINPIQISKFVHPQRLDQLSDLRGKASA